MSLRTQERESDGGACLFLLAVAVLFAVTHCQNEPSPTPSPQKTAHAVRTD